MSYGFQILSEEPLIQIEDIHDLNRGQMLTEVKCSILCFTATRLGLKNHQIIKKVRTLWFCKNHSHVLFYYQ